MKIGLTKHLRSLLIRALLSLAFAPALYSSPEFYLVTKSPGGDLASVGGHVVLRVQDVERALDVVYSWGNFEADYFLFYKKFFKGTLEDHFKVESAFSYLAIEQDPSSVIIQYRLNLSEAQKAQIMAQLTWWGEPSHRTYLYHAWLDNCSTHLRDLLAYTLGPKLQNLRHQASPLSFRDLLSHVLSPWPMVAFAIDALLNQKVDAPITLWDEMFLPDRLVHHLRMIGLLGAPQVLFLGGVW